MEVTAQPNPTATIVSQRIASIDALRGFDMFWIIGADSLVRGLRHVSDSRVIHVVAEQLEHVDWIGCHFYDLIFPLFVFLVGASSVFSLERTLQRHGRAAAYRRLVRRALILFLLGIFYYGARSRDGGPEMFRYVGVLQRIAICYLLGGLCYLSFRLRGMLVICGVLLIGYWALLTFIPVPGVGAGDFAEGRNLTNYLDQHFLPGYKWDGDWDPEGILSTLPAVASGLFGIFAGMLIWNRDIDSKKRFLCLLAAGLGCLLVGWIWSQQFPLIKKLWTSSYVLIAAGWSYVFLALFYVVIDVWRIDFWARPFVWIGMNPIAIYMLTNLIDFDSIVRRIVHQPTVDLLSPYGELVVSVLALSLAVGICGVLYRRKLFLRI